MGRRGVRAKDSMELLLQVQPLQCPGPLTRSLGSLLPSDKCTLCWPCPFSVPVLP